jgi:hypothetical protein
MKRKKKTMGELIKIILFVYAVYFVLKSIARFLFPFLFTDFQRKMGGQNRSQFRNKREGEVTIEFKGTGKKSYDKNIGEYIDYEEVKD